MTNVAVKGSDLDYLQWFMNLSEEDLGNWNRGEQMPENKDHWDGWMRHRRLFYITAGGEDDGQSLLMLQRDLRSDFEALLNETMPADEALKRLLYRIYDLKLESSRKILTAEEQREREKKQEPFMLVELERVSPPQEGEIGRRQPISYKLPVIEIPHAAGARANLYRMVDGAIRSNIISAIRQCLNCKNFFVRDGRRLTYCSAACDMEFNNKRRKNYFKERPKHSAPKKNAKQPTPANRGYDVFVWFRKTLLKGSPAKTDRGKAEMIMRWLDLDLDHKRKDRAAFMQECEKFNPDAHWKKIDPDLRQRFKSCPIVL